MNSAFPPSPDGDPGGAWPTWIPVTVVSLLLLAAFWGYFTDLGWLARSDVYVFYVIPFLAKNMIWSPYEFSGFPVFADPQSFLWYPPFQFFRALGDDNIVWNLFYLSPVVLSFVAMALYLREIKCTMPVAIAAGICFALSDVVVERFSHTSIVHATPFLPFALLFIERAMRRHSLSDIAFGAISVALLLLAGHPQISMVAGMVLAAYSLVFILRSGAFFDTTLRLGTLLGLGVLLTAVQSIPLVEAIPLMERQELRLDNFVRFALEPWQLFSYISPTVFRPALSSPTFVGLLPLIGTVLALWCRRDNWRVIFWAVTALILILLALGNSTPVAALVFELPLMDKFRVASRHIWIADTGLVILGAIGLDAIRQRWNGYAFITAAGLLGFFFMVLLRLEESPLLRIDRRPSEPQTFGADTSWESAIVALIVVILVLIWSRTSWKWLAVAVLPLAAAFDMTSDVRVRPEVGLHVGDPLGDAFFEKTSALAEAEQFLDRPQYRVSTPGARSEILIPNFMRVHEVPSSGGVNSMVLGNYSTAAQTGTRDAYPRIMRYEDRSFDVTSAGLMIISEQYLPDIRPMTLDGIDWDGRTMELRLWGDDCGGRPSRHVRFALPEPMEISTVHFIGKTRCTEQFEQGTTVANMSWGGEPDRRFGTMPIRLGVDIADRYITQAQERGTAKHQPVTPVLVNESDHGAADYHVALDLPRPTEMTWVEFEYAADEGFLEIDHLTLMRADGTPFVVQSETSFLNDKRRWELLMSVPTGANIAGPQPEGWVDRDPYQHWNFPSPKRNFVYRNKRALPRARLAGELARVSYGELGKAIRDGAMRDGTDVDFSKIAFVSTDDPLPENLLPETGEGTVEWIKDEPSELAISVSVPARSFLVVSDTYYPGWHATVDGEPTEIYRTNLAFRGVVVPEGDHVVEMSFAPMSLYIGGGISILALLGVAGLIGADLRRRGRARPA